jgi:chromosome segregation protein
MREAKRLLDRYEDVDESAEYTYEYYMNLYEELKAKMKKILEDKKSLEEELYERIGKWKRELTRYVKEISVLFNELLNGLNATGYVRVEDIDDIENARLELYVGFGGLDPIRLDAYSQSGGERTTAVMAFLLSLQKYIKSPLRAVDEFDVHMDPKNREVILNYLIKAVSKEAGQYLIITPGMISKYLGKVNVIVVQKAEGVSVPTMVREIDQ